MLSLSKLYMRVKEREPRQRIRAGRDLSWLQRFSAARQQQYDFSGKPLETNLSRLQVLYIYIYIRVVILKYILNSQIQFSDAWLRKEE